MEEGGTIDDKHARFITIVNGLESLIDLYNI